MLQPKPNSPADETEILGLLLLSILSLLRRVPSPRSLFGSGRGRWALEPLALRARLLGSENKPSELQLSRRGPLRMLRQTKVLRTAVAQTVPSVWITCCKRWANRHSRRHPLEIQVS